MTLLVASRRRTPLSARTSRPGLPKWCAFGDAPVGSGPAPLFFRAPGTRSEANLLRGYSLCNSTSRDRQAAWVIKDGVAWRRHFPCHARSHDDNSCWFRSLSELAAGRKTD